MNAFQFFKTYAGYSYGPDETPEQGKARGARALAKAERAARDGGFSYSWSIDPIASPRDWKGKRAEHYDLWQCVMYDSEGCIVNSLHSIDFGRDGSPWSDPYKRVVEAELAIDGLTNPPQGKVRA